MTPDQSRIVADASVIAMAQESHQLEHLYAIAYLRALEELAHEFESHDYFTEARKVRSFAETSIWKPPLVIIGDE